MLISIEENKLRIKVESLTEREKDFLNNVIFTDDRYIMLRRYEDIYYLEGKPKHLYKVLYDIARNHDIELI